MQPQKTLAPTSSLLMSGKTCLITGASSGIGKATAQALVSMGARVVCMSKNAVAGEQAVQEIRRFNEQGQIQFIQCDLSSQQDIRRAVAHFLNDFSTLDVLINNAGVYCATRQLTIDGIETTLAVNHLAPFLLTHLLLERLKESTTARVVNVASIGAKYATLDFDDIQATKDYEVNRVYNQSKLANMLFTFELARRLATTPMRVNCLHPGGVRTELVAHTDGMSLPLRLLYSVVRPFLLTPEQGAKTSIYLASSPEIATVSGKYFIRCKPAKAYPAALDEANLRRLWAISEQLTNVSS